MPGDFLNTFSCQGIKLWDAYMNDTRGTVFLLIATSIEPILCIRAREGGEFEMDLIR